MCLAGGHVTLSADTVNFWSCTWSCGWLRGAVASLGSALGFLLQRKHRHVTPIMTYIKPSHYISRKKAEVKCHLSPFSWCLTMTSFAQAGPSPMGEEAWFTDCCCWLWLPGDLLPIPHSTVLCGQKSEKEKPRRSVTRPVSNVLLFLSAIHRINVDWMHKHLKRRILCTVQSLDSQAKL